MSGIDFTPMGVTVQEQMTSIEEVYGELAGVSVGAVIVLTELRAEGAGQIEVRTRISGGPDGVPRVKVVHMLLSSAMHILEGDEE